MTDLTEKTYKYSPGWIFLIIPVALFIFFCSKISAVISGQTLFYGGSWVDHIGVDLIFRLDGLSMLFSLLITGIGILVVVYSIFYLKKERLLSFYIYLIMFMLSMIGVVTSDNLIVLYVFWELTSLSSFFLIGYWFERDKSKYGAQRALLITIAGGFAMLVAFIMIGSVSGTYSISELLANPETVRSAEIFPAIIILVLIGALTKSAQIPFHIWLPTAMEAPTPVSCYLHSATMVKAGIFLVARLTPVLGDNLLWQGPLVVLGVATLLFGSYMTLRQTDLKALLAYSTISQLGAIMAMLGIGTEAAIFAAMFHIFNHSAFKGSLFLVTGIVDHETGTRDMTLLKGIGRVMPITGTVAFIAAISMSGLPPFSGFLSKEMFVTAASDQATSGGGVFPEWVAAVLACVVVLASILTLAYSVSIFGKVFYGKETKAPKIPHGEASPGLILPAVVLILFNIVPAIIPNFFGRVLIAPAATAAAGVTASEHISFWHGFNLPFLLTLIIFAGGGVLYANLDRVKAFIMRYRTRVGIEVAYEKTVPGVYNAAGRLTDFYMRGSLRNYAIFILLAFLVLISYPMFMYAMWGRLSVADLAPVTELEIFMVVVAAIAAVAVAVLKKPLYAILALAGVGAMVALFFVVFRAPDLALTQLLVEICSTVLFLLTLRKMPGVLESKPKIKPGRKRINITISVIFGAIVGFMSFWSHSNKAFDPISWYYSANSLILGGGSNVVNVTLVDFRGLDTMGEITVLSIAAVGVLMLINYMSDKKEEEAENEKLLEVERVKVAKTRKSRGLPTNNVVFRVLLKPLSLIIIVTSVFLFWAGHNAPGGGFIAGLMFSGAIILIYLSRGQGFPGGEKLNYKILLPLGLSCAGGSGFLGLIFGEPFLSHYFVHIHVPFFGDLELATATIFDFGVFLVVVGTVMSIITNIGKRQEG